MSALALSPCLITCMPDYVRGPRGSIESYASGVTLQVHGLVLFGPAEGTLKRLHWCARLISSQSVAFHCCMQVFNPQLSYAAQV